MVSKPIAFSGDGDELSVVKEAVKDSGGASMRMILSTPRPLLKVTLSSSRVTL